jgi:hypothetical protein
MKRKKFQHRGDILSDLQNNKKKMNLKMRDYSQKFIFTVIV